MAAMAAELVPALGRRCLLVLDAYFAVGPVFAILRTVRDAAGRRLVHVVTRAKSNVVAYADAPPPTGRPGRPREYGEKLALIELFDKRLSSFEQARIELYGQVKDRGVSVSGPALEASRRKAAFCIGRRRRPSASS